MLPTGRSFLTGGQSFGDTNTRYLEIVQKHQIIVCTQQLHAYNVRLQYMLSYAQQALYHRKNRQTFLERQPFAQFQLFLWG